MTAVSRGEDWVEGEGGGNARGESKQLQYILHWFSYLIESFTETNYILAMTGRWQC